MGLEFQIQEDKVCYTPPKSAKNFGITELELTGLLVNIHSFI